MHVNFMETTVFENYGIHAVCFPIDIVAQRKSLYKNL